CTAAIERDAEVTDQPSFPSTRSQTRSMSGSSSTTSTRPSVRLALIGRHAARHRSRSPRFTSHSWRIGRYLPNRMPSAAILHDTAKLDPCRVADLTLAAAVRASADLVYIEPIPMTDDSYVLTFERESRAFATTSLDAHVATAMIARLAYIADIDLANGATSSGVVPVRSGSIRG